ncbi:MAG: heavy-metal-associated domain-containing protein [Mahellales bacterium]|jgi:copper chaperone
MKKKLLIEGMGCQRCVNHIKEALEGINGVKSVEVNLEEKYAEVELTQDVGDDVFKAAIDEAGYELTKVEEG